ncbi:type I restriction-modification system, S subunit [Pseudomonas aeruginosa]|nr:type I restriction-modification system, S subunit [Pseudomonas aeruginosa]HCF1476020.1 restriction endonuclease subunit S [Pseudomonas aeruginosa]
MGQAPEGSSYNEAGEGIPLLAGAGDFGEITPIPKKFTTEASKLSQSGDLILCIRATIGDLNWSDRAYCLGRGVAGLRVIEDKLDASYLWYFICTHKHELASKGTGSTFKQVNRTHIAEWEIPLPPLPEQKRIAAILDKADAIRHKRQQAIQLADDFLRAVFLDMFGDPVTNPKGWEVKSVADLIRTGVILQVQDGNHGNDHPKVSDFTESGIPFVTANVVRRGKILFDQCYYLDHSWLDKLRIGFAKPRDVLISHKGSLGFTAVLDDTYEDYIFSPQTTYYRVNEERLLPEYLKGYFDSGFFQSLFAKEGIQSTRAYLGITRQKDLPVMIPEISAQMKFLDVFSKYKNLSEKLFEPTASAEFFSSLSQKAFWGEL